MNRVDTQNRQARHVQAAIHKKTIQKQGQGRLLNRTRH